MRQLISDLVDMTHIEVGTLAVNPEPTDVPRTCLKRRGRRKSKQPGIERQRRT